MSPLRPLMNSTNAVAVNEDDETDAVLEIEGGEDSRLFGCGVVSHDGDGRYGRRVPSMRM